MKYAIFFLLCLLALRHILIIFKQQQQHQQRKMLVMLTLGELICKRILSKMHCYLKSFSKFCHCQQVFPDCTAGNIIRPSPTLHKPEIFLSFLGSG